MSKKTRILAFYLPQFHPIPENDSWWGKGFTEWTNVRKAKPLYHGHQQPVVPGELGYYDLRNPEIREKQAQFAKEHGIEGFCYWHYWFGNNKRLLELPFNEVLSSGKPGFPFCLAWANETWSGVWHGKPKKILIKQEYPGIEDYRKHFESVLEAFQDKRYIKVYDKPVYIIYRPLNIPDIEQMMELWRNLALANNLAGIHFVAHTTNYDKEIKRLSSLGFDGIINNTFKKAHLKLERNFIVRKLLYFLGVPPNIYNYETFSNFLLDKNDQKVGVYPTVVPNWDNSPRSGIRGIIIKGSTPYLFEEHLKKAKKMIELKEYNENFLFVKSWNEWAEGNYIEPDNNFGCKYLEAIKNQFLSD